MHRSLARALLLCLAVAGLSTCANNTCDTNACMGSDGVCYGPCVVGVCTTTPSGHCSAPSAGGVSCCVGGASTTTSGGGTGGGCCANWTCNGSSQCASVMGGPSGSQCGFSDSSSCGQWCQTYIPGACSCSC